MCDVSFSFAFLLVACTAPAVTPTAFILGTDVVVTLAGAPQLQISDRVFTSLGNAVTPLLSSRQLEVDPQAPGSPNLVTTMLGDVDLLRPAPAAAGDLLLVYVPASVQDYSVAIPALPSPWRLVQFALFQPPNPLAAGLATELVIPGFNFEPTMDTVFLVPFVEHEDRCVQVCFTPPLSFVLSSGPSAFLSGDSSLTSWSCCSIPPVLP